ncbi:hypothetical protein MP228_004293 [Amoeboaphelidium protococcarum]|nr:hypothetical protein MP228_004293 [Amoeboaphelidium protococcarum]
MSVSMRKISNLHEGDNIQVEDTDQVSANDPAMSRRQIRIGFAICGLINNFTYVVFLSAAQDIIKQQENTGVSEGSILLADIIPSLIVKFVFPHMMHRVGYDLRIFICIALSFISLHEVAWIPNIWIRLFGIVLASIASGLGEISFLSLTSAPQFIDRNDHTSRELLSTMALSGWSTGTGMAGVGGALAYLALTTWLRVSLTITLAIASIAPLFMAYSYFILLRHWTGSAVDQTIAGRLLGLFNLKRAIVSQADYQVLPEEQPQSSDGMYIVDEQQFVSTVSNGSGKLALNERLSILRIMFVPFMLPLFLVFMAEYTINQGVCPNLLYASPSPSLDEISRLRDAYVYYQFLYQIGVLVSRSSVEWFPIRQIWILSLLQVGTLIFLISEALFRFIPSVYLIYIVILWEGLLGGSTYVNAFNQIRQRFGADQNYSSESREFAMASAAVSDTLGISFAGLISIFLSPALCKYQVQKGIKLCKLVKQ